MKWLFLERWWAWVQRAADALAAQLDRLATWAGEKRKEAAALIPARFRRERDG